MDGLSQPGTTVTLVATGLGLGAAVAPVNAAALADSVHENHGVVSSLVMLARMVGMVVGLALLTAIGLRWYYQVAGSLPQPLNPADLWFAGIAQAQTVFAGAAGAAMLGAVSWWLGVRRESRSTEGISHERSRVTWPG